jgi:hypothetical protein
MSGFRYALVLEDGDPADPAVFSTIIPTWQEGDTFLAGAELIRFRILARLVVTEELGLAAMFHTVAISLNPPLPSSVEACDVLTGYSNARAHVHPATRSWDAA